MLPPAISSEREVMVKDASMKSFEGGLIANI